MRGKATEKYNGVSKKGITPAYAGKSCYGKMDWCMKLGSPPPMRGKVLLLLAYATINRITPAYAGKSLYHPNQL